MELLGSCTADFVPSKKQDRTPKIQKPEPGGEPVRISEGRFWLVNLDGRECDVLEEG